MKKHYSAALKAKIVQEMLKEEKTVPQLAAEYGVSTKQLNRWKTLALVNLLRLFEGRAKKRNRPTNNKCKSCIPRLAA